MSRATDRRRSNGRRFRLRLRRDKLGEVGFRPAMGVVKLLERVAVRFSFNATFSRLELGPAFGLLAAPRMGRCRARRREPAKVRMLVGWKGLERSLWWRLTSGYAVRP